MTAATTAGPLIACDRLVRIYTAEGIEVQALQGLDMAVADGELTAMVGASGSGKSTLMNILAGLDTPTAGSVRVAGHDLGAMNGRQRLAYRRRVVGFVWQQTSRNLLPYLTALQNVDLPMRLAGTGRRQRRGRAGQLHRHLHVLGRGQVRQQVARGLLPDKGDRAAPVREPLPRVQRRQVVPGDPHRAGRRGVEPGQDVHQRGLAAARRAH